MKNRITGKRAELVLMLGLVAFVVGRFAVVYGAFGPYGANPWIFLLLDLVTVWPYGRSATRIVIGLRHRRYDSVIAWAAAMAAAFAVPYLYVVFAARQLPFELIAGLTVFVALMGLLAVRKIRNTVRQVSDRKEAAHEATS